MNVNATARTLLALAPAAALLLGASGALAHARLVDADPAPNATAASPKSISLRFSERFEPRFSGLALARADGAKVAIGPAKPDAKDPRRLDAALAAPLAPGAYRLSWHAVGDDGHRTHGAYVFTVR